MRGSRLRFASIATVFGLVLVAAAHAQVPEPPWFSWSTVANNNDSIPGVEGRTFNSYNAPSINAFGLVVFRARSRGGPPLGPATHGIYARDMSGDGGPIVMILDRSSPVPPPNNLGTLFVETPSFPRIDMWSDTVATRGNHQPVWTYTVGGLETRAGTTGVYTNPYGDLITGASKLGAVPGFSFFEVPEEPGTFFDVFPGAPAATDRTTIVFKGNYTVGGAAKTGVYYRELDDAAAGGDAPVVLVANTDTAIPGTTTLFGSVSPPTAVGRTAVFAGFDDEARPSVGGLYLAPLSGTLPPLTALVSIGQRVPGEGVPRTFAVLGEGAAFDGRFVAFWGAWGDETRTVRLYCPQEGNKDRIDYCNQRLVCATTGEIVGDPRSTCDDETDPNYPVCYQERQVPVEQGIFTLDLETGRLRTVAKTGARFVEFLFWNYSGRVPCIGATHGGEGGEEDGEAARWRSSAFMAVAGQGDEWPYTAFKAATGDATGVYLGRWPGQAAFTVLDSRTPGPWVDLHAPAGSMVTEVGLEREGLRGTRLVLNARMGVPGGTEEEGMAGIYLTFLPPMP